MRDLESVLKCIKLNKDKMQNTDFDTDDIDFDNMDENEIEEMMSVSDYAFYMTDGSEFHNLDKQIENIVVYMPNNIEVDDAFCFRNGFEVQACVIAFSNGDIALLKETKGTVTHERSFTFGGFLDSTYNETVYGCNKIEMPAKPINDVTTKFIIHEKNVGIFKKKMQYDHAEIIIGYMDNNNIGFTLECEADLAKYVFDYIIKRLKKYAKEPQAAATPAPEAEKPAGDANNIAEIRKLYEDGIITRDEMLDLIKNGK